MPYKNIEDRKKQAKRYYKQNKEKINENCKKWREENKEKIKEYLIKLSKYYRNSISKSYAASKLKIPLSQLTDEMYEQYKLSLKIKRKIKQLNQCENQKN